MTSTELHRFYDAIAESSIQWSLEATRQ